jgi:ATP-dependent Clp protease ATP-binding subunit ClpA
MFERFTDNSRDLVRRAQSMASGMGHVWVGTEHLLLAAALDPEATGTILTGLGLSPERVDAAVRAHLAASTTPDRATLAAIGIDLDRVQEALELDAEPSSLELQLDKARTWLHRSGPPRDRRPRGNALPFTSSAKESLELSLKESSRLDQKRIEPVHIALGILRQGRGVACAVLAELDIDTEALTHQLEAAALAAA